jgi:two-component system copper resistance phosphate regulon response regulator CusR
VPRALVVDDEPRICRFVARALQAHDFEVDVAPGGAEGLRLLGTRGYAIVVLDLLMPGMDGYQVLRRIVDTYPTQKVLVLSAVGDVDSKVRCLRMGAADYLPKPFAIAELVERIRRRLRDGTAPPAQRWLEVGEVRLDLQRHSVRVGDRAVSLSQREFVLLGHLMRRAGEVCSREELLSAVWGSGYDAGSSNVVDVYVRRLRAKLQRSLIETVRNVGYSFVAD